MKATSREFRRNNYPPLNIIQKTLREAAHFLQQEEITSDMESLKDTEELVGALRRWWPEPINMSLQKSKVRVLIKIDKNMFLWECEEEKRR